MDFAKIAIIDYQMSNLFSVKNACNAMGINSVVTSDPKIIMRASGAVLPGVGAFGDAMKNLRRLGLSAPIKDFVKTGRKFMGVCLGMQLLFTESEEFGKHAGLNILAGQVMKLNEKNPYAKVPQIGWNTIFRPKNTKINWLTSPLKHIKNNDYFYFVHSFFVKPEHKTDILSLTEYEGIEYCSVILHNNILATQFHPEKSGEKGLLIYHNFFK